VLVVLANRSRFQADGRADADLRRGARRLRRARYLPEARGTTAAGEPTVGHADDLSRASHAWDTQAGAVNFFDPNAALGKGGRVRFLPDGKLADRSRNEAAKFFAQAFALTPPTKP
jgi:hypothetical protein